MQVLIPSPLRSYTANAAEVEAEGENLGDLLLDLDRRYPGIKFRMIDEQDCLRPHIRIFVNKVPAFDLSLQLSGSESVKIVCALSGG